MAEGQGQSKESKYLQSPLLHIILWPTHSPNRCLKWALPRVIQHDSTHICLFWPTALPSSLTFTPSFPQRILSPFSFLPLFWQLLSCLDAEVCTACTCLDQVVKGNSTSLPVSLLTSGTAQRMDGEQRTSACGTEGGRLPCTSASMENWQDAGSLMCVLEVLHE